MFEAFASPFDDTRGMWESLKRTASLSSPVQTHVRAVYTWLTLTLAAASAGAYTHLYVLSWLRGGTFSMLVGLGCMLAVMAMRPTPETGDVDRKGLLLAFGYFQGVSLGPLLETLLDFYPGILTSALVSTTLVFASFTASAMLSDRRSMIYLGGMLTSALSILLWLSLANAVFGNYRGAMYTAELPWPDAVLRLHCL